MLDLLRESGAGSDRKFRLFTAACCRRAWHLLDADCRAVVETSERLADESASQAELMAAVWASRGDRDIDARMAVDSAAVGAWRPAVALLAAVCGRPAGSVAAPSDPSASGRECFAQADLLRCVLGNPFRLVTAGPAWLSWRDGAVAKMAQAAYDELALPSGDLDAARLAVLADALEEAGCADAAILAHLRGPGPHVRGCWVVDVLTGRG
jgi:hypothetical protein